MHPRRLSGSLALPAGTRLGPYEIVSFLADGGMGGSLSGRDTRLDRSGADMLAAQPAP